MDIINTARMDIVGGGEEFPPHFAHFRFIF